MIGLKEAAQMIGYSVPGLRDLVKRRKIKSFQPHAHCPIKFRQEWLDEFRKRASYRPEQETTPQLETYPRTFSEALDVFTPAVALRLILDSIRSHGWPRCPDCDSRRIAVDTSGACKCRNCGRKYRLLDGTACQGLSASLRLLLIAAWCLTVGKDRIPVNRFAAAFCISQTKAEKVLAKLRELVKRR
jgi:hypothetical protein